MGKSCVWETETRVSVLFCFFPNQNEVSGETGLGLAQVRAGVAFMLEGEVPALGNWPTGRKDVASQWERRVVRSQTGGRMGPDHSGLLPEDRTASGQAVPDHTHCLLRCVSGTSSYRVISWEGWAQQPIPQCWLGACLLSPTSQQD